LHNFSPVKNHLKIEETWNWASRLSDPGQLNSLHKSLLICQLLLFQLPSCQFFRPGELFSASLPPSDLADFDVGPLGSDERVCPSLAQHSSSIYRKHLSENSIKLVMVNG
jgi:hypothetical protein